jgi:hypothetical protein
MRTRWISIVCVIAVSALAVAGCGGGGGGGGEPAGLVPKAAPVYVQANLAPDGKTSAALNEVAASVLGIDNVGEFVAEELENAAIGDDEKLNFEEEIEPWLGEKAGLYLAGYDGDNFHGVGMALETTDSGEAEEFIEKRVASGDEKAKEGEFEGNKYYENPDEESVIGMVGDYLAFSETTGGFEEMVKAFEGEGLNESPKFKEAMDNAPEEGIGSVYVDIGGLIEKSKGSIPLAYQALFGLVGIEPRQATAMATIVPHSEHVEIDLSAEPDTVIAASGGASELLESMPADAVAGFGLHEFGLSLGKRVEELNQAGIPGQMKPGELEAALGAVGINLESIAESLGDVGGFVEGTSAGHLGGAIVIETRNAPEARRTVSKIGSLLRATGTLGITAISSPVSGFSVHSRAFGPMPFVVGTVGPRIVVSYGPGSASKAVNGRGPTLGSTADFKVAKGALGPTPISGFVDGHAVPGLIEMSLKTGEKAEFDEVKPFLRKVSYLAVGSEAEGGTQTAKLIVGLTK